MTPSRIRLERAYYRMRIDGPLARVLSKMNFSPPGLLYPLSVTWSLSGTPIDMTVLYYYQQRKYWLIQERFAADVLYCLKKHYDQNM